MARKNSRLWLWNRRPPCLHACLSPPAKIRATAAAVRPECESREADVGLRDGPRAGKKSLGVYSYWTDERAWRAVS